MSDDDLSLYIRDNRVWYCLFEHNKEIVRLSTGVKVNGRDAGDIKRTRPAALDVGKRKRADHIRTTPNLAAAPVRASTKKGEEKIPDRPTVGWALERCWKKRWSRSRSAIVLKHVIPAMQREIGQWYIDEVTETMIDDYLGALQEAPAEGRKSLANSTVNRRRSALRKALGDVCGKNGVAALPVFPQRKVERNKKHRYIKPAEEVAILEWFEKQALDDHVDKRPEWVFMGDLTASLIDTGLRFSEIFRATIPDGVDPEIDGRFVDLTDGKGQEDDVGRRVPLTDRARVSLPAVMNSPYYKRTDDPEEIAKLWDWCSARFEQCVEALKINTPQTPKKERVTIHICRHTTASRLTQGRMDIRKVKEWMGHKNINTTMRYAHLNPGSLIEGLAALQGRPFGVPQSLTGARALPDVDESTGTKVSIRGK